MDAQPIRNSITITADCAACGDAITATVSIDNDRALHRWFHKMTAREQCSPSEPEYKDADRAVFDYLDGRDTLYRPRKHSRAEIIKHDDHAAELSNSAGVTALCCHTCSVFVAY